MEERREKTKRLRSPIDEEPEIFIRADSPLGRELVSNTQLPDSQDSIEVDPTEESDKISSSSFLFVPWSHPHQHKDSRSMTENRRHVMNDYLDKERRRPGSRDFRVNASTRTSRKGRFPNTRLSPSVGPRSRQSSLQPGSTRFTSPESSSITNLLDDDHDIEDTRLRTIAGTAPSARTTIRRTHSSSASDKSLVYGIHSRFEQSAYVKIMLKEIPAGPGTHVEPFNTWPTLIDPSLDLNALKLSCCQHFGSHNLSTHWIPTVLRARHAFLSSLCISSSHDAIMTQALVPSQVQSTNKSIERWKIKRDVISMVAGVMDDLQQQAADETIVAVLQLLNSDVMSCDDRDIRIHQDGLRKMVEQRGGLENLGVGGELAVVLTITNYLIASLREQKPHEDYVHFASKRDTQIPSGFQKLPESPVYCLTSGFRTLTKALAPESAAFWLLDTVRSLTTEFYTETEKFRDFQKARCHSTDSGMDKLLHQILNSAPASEMAFEQMNNRYTYESIRLAARIYSFALSKHVSFSTAAVELARQDGLHTTLPVRLKNAIMRTDMSTCWDHLGGVLFWIAIVGSAAASSGPYEGGNEDARKFLATVAVRCCIVLSFQYGRAVLETLKRMVMIETTLSSSHLKDPQGTCTAETWTLPPPQPGSRRAFGPIEAHKGFADFLLDWDA